MGKYGLLPVSRQGQPPGSDANVKVSVLQCNWGDARHEDIQCLLEDVASHIHRELRNPLHGTVTVMNLPTEESPRTFFRRSCDTEVYQINLTAKDRLWSRFAYQFAHEYCHVLSGYDRLRDNPNNWFHETICELASAFVLRRMGERWRDRPPYVNWASYSACLTTYADSLTDRLASKSPTGCFQSWLSANEDLMRSNPYLRDLNGVVAMRLLPLFEREPSGWNAVGHLPNSTARIYHYIDSWSTSVNELDRSFVESIGHAMGSP